MKIHISETTYQFLEEEKRYHCVERGLTTIKVSTIHYENAFIGTKYFIFQGKGELRTYWLLGYVAGNTNVKRISSRNNDRTPDLISSMDVEINAVDHSCHPTSSRSPNNMKYHGSLCSISAIESCISHSAPNLPIRRQCLSPQRFPFLQKGSHVTNSYCFCENKCLYN